MDDGLKTLFALYIPDQRRSVTYDSSARLDPGHEKTPGRDRAEKAEKRSVALWI